MICGSSGSIRPSHFFQSLGFTRAARTAIRAWPGPGCGSGRSTISSTSGPPNRLKRTAFIVRASQIRLEAETSSVQALVVGAAAISGFLGGAGEGHVAGAVRLEAGGGQHSVVPV